MFKSIYDTRFSGHFMTEKEDFSFEIFTHLDSVFHYVSLFFVCYNNKCWSKSSVCYSKIDVSLDFLCVTCNTQEIDRIAV